MEGKSSGPCAATKGMATIRSFNRRGTKQTFGEMDRWEKNRISHRADAFRKLVAGLNAEDWQHGGFGLYLHWPFCMAKCPYCDFNSHVASHVDQARWKAAFLSEIKRYGDFTERTLNTVFFGGGTPS